MTFFERTKQILSGTNPVFWDQVRKERGVGEPFRYFLGLMGVFIVLFALFLFGSVFVMGNAADFQNYAIPSLGLSPAAGLVLIAGFVFCVMLGGLFVSAGIQHLFIKMFKGTGDFAHTYRAFAYASAPNMILGFIPVVGSLAGLFSFYLQIRGISELHGFTFLKALGVSLVTFLAVMAVMVAVVLGFIAVLANIPGFQFS